MKLEEIMLTVDETKWWREMKLLSGHSCEGFLESSEKGIRFSWKCDLVSSDKDNSCRLFYKKL